MIKVFISYAREDQTFAKEIYDFLKRNGYKPWMDKQNLVPGMNWQQEIENAVTNSDVQIFLLSPRSVEKRGVFQREIRYALDKAQELLDCDISIIPFRLEECDAPDALRKYQWLDYSDPQRDKKLISALFLAAKQRGLLDGQAERQPVVSAILSYEDRSADGHTVISFEVPEITIPPRPELGRMISSIVHGQASELTLGFKREMKNENFWSEHRARPNEMQFATHLHFLNDAVLSASNDIYQERGGPHGYGYTRSLNVLIEEGLIFTGGDLLATHEFVGECINKEAEVTGDYPLVEGENLKQAILNALENNTLISEAGILIRFNQYDVFCYAHGPFEIEKSWRDNVLADSNLTELGRRIKILVHSKP